MAPTFKNLDKYYTLPNQSVEEKEKRRNALITLCKSKNSIKKKERFEDFAHKMASKFNVNYEKYQISHYPSYSLTFSHKREQKNNRFIQSTKYVYLFSLIERE